MLETSAPSDERHGCLPAEAGRCTERCDFHITSGVLIKECEHLLAVNLCGVKRDRSKSKKRENEKG